ncbi:amidohydrolase family protein [Halobacterium bonnevillei]|uniref:Amidohydrolase family protein n=1 Tax=Halobacterium bonnevillei TaxID=2692200 RepID=A0A6B0SCB4_9EURY|nr:amidohydrolase family protein [Halobacterium bonnevillei]MXR19355.1 amidohydrolase family protein [Halobacterium bonnevillei]
MASQDVDPQREVPADAFDERIIDLDFHMNPPEETLIQYVEDDVAREKFENVEYGMAHRKAKWDAAWAIPGGNEGLFTQGRAEVASDVKLAAEKFAIDDPIVNVGINNAPTQHNPVQKNAIAQAANDFALDRIVPEDLHCLMMVPQWDVDYAVEEIHRVADEDGIVGAYGWFGPFDLFGDTKFDPLFEALVEHDLPLVLHGSLSFWPQDTPYGDGMLTWTEILGFDWPIHAMLTTVNAIMSGVFDKFPELDIVIEEGGHWWVPFVKYRMDEFYEMHPGDIKMHPRLHEMGQERLQRTPSEYLRENVYVTTQPMAPPERSTDFEAMLDLSMAEDMFLYSSDWPHQTLDPATWAFTNRAFDEDLRAAVLHENAEELFGI